MKKLIIALLLVASPCFAGPEIFLTINKCVPSGTQTTVNGISSIVSGGTEDTGTESINIGCGIISVYAECTGGSGTGAVYLRIDGDATGSILSCSAGETKSATLTRATTGTRDVMIQGTKAGTGTFLANAFSIPLQ